MNPHDALEDCLRAIEHGETPAGALQRHPELADKLRPLLDAAVQARRLRGAEAPPEVFLRGRARVLGRAASLRRPRPLGRVRAIAALQRMALTLVLLATLLGSGTGLVRAAADSIPGEQLYPFKRTVESVRLFVVAQPPRRLALLGTFEAERLDEIDELFAQGRQAEISFTGVFLDFNGKTYVSGIPVVITAATELPPQGLHNGATVRAIGWSHPERYVELASVNLLAGGEIVPVGRPVLLEDLRTSAGIVSNSPDLPGTEDMPHPEFQFEGTVESMGDGVIVVSSRSVYISDPAIGSGVYPGAKVEVEGYFDSDARFVATSIEVEDEFEGSPSGDDLSQDEPESDDEEETEDDGIETEDATPEETDSPESDS